MQLMRRTSGSGHTHTLIYFITGNPGLIGYYETFFDTITELLSDQPNKFTIYGEDLAGFGEASHEESKRKNPYGLEEQIDHVYDSMQSQISSSGEDPYHSLILIGHSVGSYILLEILQRLIEEQDKLSRLKIHGGVLLFPTITHIAQSPSGLTLTRLLKIPRLERAVQSFVRYSLACLPFSVLKSMVKVITGMPDGAASVTTRFLRSPMGVWQALHMARDEMENITEDKWNDDIWGVENSTEQQPIPKLYFYFGQNDHWVANHTRDALIALRSDQSEGSVTSWKPKMIIDQQGTPHGFCIKHSEFIAEQVAKWLIDVVRD